MRADPTPGIAFGVDFPAAWPFEGTAGRIGGKVDRGGGGGGTGPPGKVGTDTLGLSRDRGGGRQRRRSHRRVSEFRQNVRRAGSTRKAAIDRRGVSRWIGLRHHKDRGRESPWGRRKAEVSP